MASLRSRLLNSSTRILMAIMCRRLSGPLDFRRVFQALDDKARHPGAADVSIRDESFGKAGELNGRWFEPSELNSGKCILYLHGGAFIMRMPAAHGAMITRFCQALKASAFMPWYRLAPEHVYPAAPQDCLSAYCHLLQCGIAAEDITVMGDSAGGNLALGLIHLLKEHGLPMPGGVVMLSPVLDMAQLSASWRLNVGRDPMYRVQAQVNPVAHYLPPGCDLITPTVSPCYGDIKGFPPLLTVVGDIECLLDDSVALIKKAVENEVPAQVHIWRGMPHVFPLQTFFPETPLAMARIVTWIKGVADAQVSYRGAVRVYDRQPLIGRLRDTDNQLYLSNAK